MSEMEGLRFDAIGTGWQIDTPEPLAGPVKAVIAEEVERFDRTWSRFRTDSVVAALTAAERGGSFAFPSEGAALFDLYDRLHALTAGAVDPLVGGELARLGYDREYSLRPRLPATGPRPDWRRDVRRDGTTLHTRAPVVLDVGAAGKGLLVDRLAALLRSAGLRRFVVDGGGDMLHAGPAPLRVGLEHPSAPDRVVGIVEIREQALCASAVTRRCWGDGLHHVIDGRTGNPTRDMVATWVIAPDAMTADGLATALFFAGTDGMPDAPGVAWVRQRSDGRLERSANFPGELFA